MADNDDFVQSIRDATAKITLDMEKKVPVNMGKTKAFRQTAGTPH
jgi:hypothetical protein